jgi:hypothetical protein
VRRCFAWEISASSSSIGREDAVGQARAIEGLYRSAAEGIPVGVQA